MFELEESATQGARMKVVGVGGGGLVPNLRHAFPGDDVLSDA